MAASAWIGVDLGTSSLKVVAVGNDGILLEQHEAALPVDRPGPDRAEADPGAWTRAVDEAMEPLAAAYDVRSVAITGQMHGTVLLDEDDLTVRPAVLWPDSRSHAQQARWDHLPPPLLGRLGNPWTPGMTGPVLAWLSEHEPEAVRRAARVALPKDHVREHLDESRASRDVAVTDPTDASGTLLWDVAERSWVTGVDALVPSHLLPGVVGSAEVRGSWRGVDLHVGAGDTPASLLAVERTLGAWQPGDLVVNLGTGAQVIDPVAPPPSGSGWPLVHTGADAAGGDFAMVAAANAGLALTWAQEQLGLDWEQLAGLAATAPAGADGVLFSPFVSPERGALRSTTEPGWTRSDPTAALAARAAVEAQAFLVRRAAELLDAPAQRVLVVGGGARADWVRQLLADVLARPIQHVPMRSAAAAGAVLLADGPLLGGGTGPTPLTEPVPDPALEDAYARWVARCYPDESGQP